MKRIDWLRKATEDVMEAINWPARKRLINRGFESIIDAADIQKDKMEGRLNELRKSLTKATDDNQARDIIKKIIDAKADYEASVENARLATEERDYQNEEYVEEK